MVYNNLLCHRPLHRLTGETLDSLLCASLDELQQRNIPKAELLFKALQDAETDINELRQAVQIVDDNNASRQSRGVSALKSSALKGQVVCFSGFRNKSLRWALYR